MNNREQYKRIVYFFSTLIIVALLTLEFAFTWYTAYSDVIALPFYRRGNWVLVLIYAVLFLIILKASGGYKVGYLKRGDIALLPDFIPGVCERHYLFSDQPDRQTPDAGEAPFVDDAHRPGTADLLGGAVQPVLLLAVSPTAAHHRLRQSVRRPAGHENE